MGNPYVVKQVTTFSDGSETVVTNSIDPYLNLPVVDTINSDPVPEVPEVPNLPE